MGVWRQATVGRAVDELRVRSERDRVVLLEICDAKGSVPPTLDRPKRKALHD